MAILVAEVATEAENPETGSPGRHGAQELERAVLRAIVHEDDLPADADITQDHVEPALVLRARSPSPR